MPKPEQYVENAQVRPHGNRAYPRRKLGPMAYVELGQENGGILLNLAEGGFAVQSALALTSHEFPELRFQLPAMHGWLTASGRVTWLSDSKKEAGIQFTALNEQTRSEIRAWVSSEGDAAAPRERSSPSREGNREPARLSEKAYGAPPIPQQSTRTPLGHEPRRVVPAARQDRPRGAESVRGLGTGRVQHAPRIQAPPPVQGAPGVRESIRVAEPVRSQEPVRTRTSAVATPRSTPEPVPQTQQVTAAMAEPPVHDFRFNDYSMFSAEPHREVVWMEPKPHRGWSRAGVIGGLVAALFFALGATIGRETVDRWITSLEHAVQSPVMVTKTTPPPVPDELSAANNPKSEANSGSAGDQASGGQASDRQGASTSAANRDTDNDTSATNPRKASPDHGRDENGTAKTRASEPSSVTGRQPRSSAESGTVRSGRGLGSENDSSRVPGEHSILVNAPEPGSHPFYVNLPNEAISASGTIAISARRTLEVLPISSPSASRSERVVIGKLMAHSDPFYPTEARKQRIEGSVELRARVGRTGEVIGVTPVSGPGLLMSAAATAVREWRYEPTYVNGDPMETIADITMDFRLP